jgi:MerR family mercuric resistance operon transcriptional regulator
LSSSHARGIIRVALRCKVKGSSAFFAGRSRDIHGGRQEREVDRRDTITQLAEAAGVPTTTLRYYERVGLLEAEGRSEGNYRLYTDESLRRLRFVRAAQAVGFTLEDVKALLGAEDGRTPSCPEVQGLIQERLADIEQRLKDLHQVRQVLRSSLEKCIGTGRAGCCPVIEELRGTS